MTSIPEPTPPVACRVLFACGRIRNGVLEMRYLAKPGDAPLVLTHEHDESATQAA